MNDTIIAGKARLVAGAVDFEELERAIRAIGPVEDGGRARSPDELIGCVGAFRESPTQRNSEMIAAAHGIRRQAVGIMRLELRSKR